MHTRRLARRVLNIRGAFDTNFCKCRTLARCPARYLDRLTNHCHESIRYSRQTRIGVDAYPQRIDVCRREEMQSRRGKPRNRRFSRSGFWGSGLPYPMSAQCLKSSTPMQICTYTHARIGAISRGVSRRHPLRIRGGRSRVEPPGLFHGVRNDRYTYTSSGSH